MADLPEGSGFFLTFPREDTASNAVGKCLVEAWQENKYRVYSKKGVGK